MDEPPPIRGTLAKLAAGWGLENPMETARLFASWDQIVGPEVAARCKPTSLRAGVLRVRAGSPAWASELKYLSGHLIERVNGELGREVVTEIKPWVQNRPDKASEMARAGPPAPRAGTTARASSEHEEQAEELAGDVADERLADALRRAFKASKITEASHPR